MIKSLSSRYLLYLKRRKGRVACRTLREIVDLVMVSCKSTVAFLKFIFSCDKVTIYVSVPSCLCLVELVMGSASSSAISTGIHILPTSTKASV